MHRILALIHRYTGLVLALPLFVAGLGGAVIAFQEEIDAALNPTFFHARHPGPALAPGVLAARIEEQLPDAELVFMPLARQPGRTARTFVVARAGKEPLGFNEVAVDPATGAIVGKRLRGKASLHKQDVVSFIYRLHHSLALGKWGTWIMGIAATVWLVDCCLAVALTLPRRWPWWPRWAKSWHIKTTAGLHRAVFDTHRAGGLWPWLLLVIVAASAIHMNLPNQVFRPVVGWFATLSPAPHVEPPSHAGAARVIGWDGALTLAQVRAAQLGWTDAAGWVHWDRDRHSYGVCFCTLDPNTVDAGARRELRIDASSGLVTTLRDPSTRTAADVFVDLQYPLHTGRLGGFAGRVAIAAAGIAVAVLALTGVWLFLRRHLRRPVVGRRT